MVARQWEEANEIAYAVVKNADTVAAALEQHFAAESGDPPPVNWRAVLDGLSRKLLEASRSLTEQDSEYQIQLLLLAFMLVEVAVEPVWKMSSGNWSSVLAFHDLVGGLADGAGDLARHDSRAPR